MLASMAGLWLGTKRNLHLDQMHTQCMALWKKCHQVIALKSMSITDRMTIKMEKRSQVHVPMATPGNCPVPPHQKPCPKILQGLALWTVGQCQPSAQCKQSTSALGNSHPDWIGPQPIKPHGLQHGCNFRLPAHKWQNENVPFNGPHEETGHIQILLTEGPAPTAKNSWY